MTWADRGRAQVWLKAHLTYSSDDCLKWPFSCSEEGRPAMLGTTACREMCRAAHGEPPTKEHEAAHSCGNGHLACINPRHLRWATPQENAADRLIHRTDARGENSYRAVLTDDDIKVIRLLAPTSTRRELADRFGVSYQNIYKIVTRKRWSHVA